MFETNGGSNKIGLGGWLSVWLILICFGLIRFIFDINLHMLSGDGWDGLTNPDSKFYHPLWRPLLYFEFVFQFFNPVSLVCLLFLYASKSHFFPKAAIAFYLINFSLVLIDAVSAISIGKSVNLEYGFPWKEIFRSLFGVCVWIPYFVKSERVKATFVK